MASPPPIPCAFIDGAFRPLKGFHNVASAHYGEGEIVALVPHEDRSMNSHRHYFACVREAWQNLRENDAERFPTDKHLRAYALIKTGHRDESSIVCKSNEDALRVAAWGRQPNDYSLVVVSGRVVSRYTAKSQSTTAMGAKVFQQSKDDVLAFLAEMIGVDPADLSRARAA